MNTEHIERLLAASQTCSELGQRLVELPEAREEAMQAGLVCSMASLIMSEMAKHLADGAEPYEALRRTALGELSIPPEKATALRVVAGLPKSEGAPLDEKEIQQAQALIDGAGSGDYKLPALYGPAWCPDGKPTSFGKRFLRSVKRGHLSRIESLGDDTDNSQEYRITHQGD